MTDFWAVLFTPSFVTRLMHVFFASWTAGAALVAAGVVRGGSEACGCGEEAEHIVHGGGGGVPVVGESVVVHVHDDGAVRCRGAGESCRVYGLCRVDAFFDDAG